VHYEVYLTNTTTVFTIENFCPPRVQPYACNQLQLLLVRWLYWHSWALLFTATHSLLLPSWKRGN